MLPPVVYLNPGSLCSKRFVINETPLNNATAGSFIAISPQCGGVGRKSFIISQTSLQYTTAGSFIEGQNIKAFRSPSAVGRSAAVFVAERVLADGRVCPRHAPWGSASSR